MPTDNFKGFYGFGTPFFFYCTIKWDMSAFTSLSVTSHTYPRFWQRIQLTELRWKKDKNVFFRIKFLILVRSEFRKGFWIPTLINFAARPLKHCLCLVIMMMDCVNYSHHYSTSKCKETLNYVAVFIQLISSL